MRRASCFIFFQTVNTLSAVLNAQTEREMQTNEFLKSTISDISHQLKTPLSAISIYNELIAEIAVIIIFFILSVAAGIKAPIKRLNEMSVTETIGQL